MQIKREEALLLVIDIQQRLMPAIHNSEAVISQSAKMIRGCQCLGVPVLVTQQYTKGLGETVREVKEALGIFEYFEKRAFSCWREEGFPKKIEEAHKNDIIITGAETHVCVQQTVLDLIHNGYRVFVAADCVSSRKEEDRHWGMALMQQAGAVITTMESLLFEMLSSSKAPEFKSISAIVK